MANAQRTTWKRARQPEQKELRRAEILDAAAKLLEDGGIEAAGLNAIARDTGMSKPNLYRYFESREAILLQLLLAEQARWSRSFRQRLRPLAGSGDVDAVARAFAKSITGRKSYCVLIGGLASVLEHNVSVDTVRGFKRQLLELNVAVVSGFQAALPPMSVEVAHSTLAMMLMAASGIWPHCHPAAAVAEVLQEEEFAAFRFDFEEIMTTHATALLRGLSLDRKP